MLRYEVDGSVAWATLDRADKLNAMPRSFWGELEATLARADADEQVRVLIFRGAGRCFSVGGDIEGFGNLRDSADRRNYVREALGALRAVDQFSKPTIAAVHGHALGGGCELTMVCDIVVADETARFGTPESLVGLVPGLGVVRGLSQLNLHWMKYMVFTGEPLDAHEAQAAGLVNRVTQARRPRGAGRGAGPDDCQAGAVGARRRQADPQPTCRRGIRPRDRSHHPAPGDFGRGRRDFCL